MTLNIDNPALIILIISTGLFIFISFIKYAFETITLEILYLWRKEEKDGISRLENLIQNQDTLMLKAIKKTQKLQSLEQIR